MLYKKILIIIFTTLTILSIIIVIPNYDKLKALSNYVSENILNLKKSILIEQDTTTIYDLNQDDNTNIIDLIIMKKDYIKSSNLLKVSKNTKVLDVINNPLFSDFGNLIFPTERGIDENMTLENIDTLLPYHNNINVNTTVEVINTMLNKAYNGETIFYDIYTDEEKLADPTKKDTGLFFFRGEINKPFAIVNAGGGFSYVGSIHESFPHALELSKLGYNGFALKYRTGGADVAYEDLARAISFIFTHANELQINTDNYSLWGGSAGARMVAYIGSYGTSKFENQNFPKPSAIIMQYTGYSDYTENDPSTFACVGENDNIANWKIMSQRIDNLNNL